MEQSYIRIGLGRFMTYVGPDAKLLLQAQDLSRRVCGWLHGYRIAGKADDPDVILAEVSKITRCKYDSDLVLLEMMSAARDLDVWCCTMQTALPVVES